MYESPRLISISTLNQGYGYDHLSMGVVTCTLLVNVNVGVNINAAVLAIVVAAADIFLQRYEEGSGTVVRDLGFWELAAAARPLPDPALWIPASRELGDAGATDERASTDYYEFVSDATRRAYSGR